jgi:hypothetical protein
MHEIDKDVLKQIDIMVDHKRKSGSSNKNVNHQSGYLSYWYLTKGKLAKFDGRKIGPTMGTLRNYGRKPSSYDVYITEQRDSYGNALLYDGDGDNLLYIIPREELRNPDSTEIIRDLLNKINFERGYPKSISNEKIINRMMNEYVDRKKGKPQTSKPNRKCKCRK